jgi:hypothetical protein
VKGFESLRLQQQRHRRRQEQVLNDATRRIRFGANTRLGLPGTEREGRQARKANSIFATFHPPDRVHSPREVALKNRAGKGVFPDAWIDAQRRDESSASRL